MHPVLASRLWANGKCSLTMPAVCTELLQTQRRALSAAEELSRLRCCRSNELGKVPKAEPLSDFSAETRVPTASRTTSDGPNSGWELEPRQSQSGDSSLLDCRRRSGRGARRAGEEGEPEAADADPAAQDTSSP